MDADVTGARYEEVGANEEEEEEEVQNITASVMDLAEVSN
jgi:hypothetical protein